MVRVRVTSSACGWEVIYPVLGPIPNGAGTMVLRVVFLFLRQHRTAALG